MALLLAGVYGISMINNAQWTSPDKVFLTDACLAGCGGVCDDQYFHGVFPWGFSAFYF